MATNLEKKKLKMELLKVAAAIGELEYKVEERQEDIIRMENHINLQKERQKELEQQLINTEE